MIKIKESIFVLTFIIIALYSFPLYPNGGPIEGSNLESTGNVQLKTIDNVDLVYEKLTIKPIDDYVKVQVIYELNCKDDTKTVEYGFPFYNTNNSFVDFKSFKDRDNDYIKSFVMTLNGSVIKLNENISKVKNKTKVEDDEVKWYLSQLTLKKGINYIEINYFVKSYFREINYEGDYSNFRAFEYNFKPAKGWGNGIIDKLEIFIDAFPLTMKNADLEIKGIKGFQKKENMYHVVIEKANFSKLQNMKIDYNLNKYYNNYSIKTLKNKKSFVKNIFASSSLKGPYSAKNLIDGSFKTSWAEGVVGNGIEEWIEVDFQEGVKNIAIANGFMRSSELFDFNSRVKTVQCDIQGNKKGADKSTFSFSKTITFDDLKNKYELLTWDSAEEYQAAYKEKKLINIIIAPEDFDSDYEITKIRLTIKEVYPGTKFEDTCITELFAF